ncbi:hypothetical protein OG439_07910 [Amycolatopsis sp. NBC_01307]|uniref:hypothetical protein n=1 Tax=Amycolatopsis sp. NBC_01307 TaxID=2903561 RepID=UPI002E160253|nr:hypothetical protein OG439_07910 [Amycolatopsis sp. NBC_01307]
MHTIEQGDHVIADVGDQVLCLGTTSCALVMAFAGNGRIACYHWPFMSDTGDCRETFRWLVDQLDSPVTHIEVISNDFPDAHRAQDCKATVTNLAAANPGAITTYYVHPGQIQGIDPFVTLGSHGAQSFHAVQVVPL